MPRWSTVGCLLGLSHVALTPAVKAQEFATVPEAPQGDLRRLMNLTPHNLSPPIATWRLEFELPSFGAVWGPNQDGAPLAGAGVRFSLAEHGFFAQLTDSLSAIHSTVVDVGYMYRYALGDSRVGLSYEITPGLSSGLRDDSHLFGANVGLALSGRLSAFSLALEDRVRLLGSERDGAFLENVFLVHVGLGFWGA